MAHKEIYICDLCEKVIELVRPFRVIVSIVPGTGGVTQEQRKWSTISTISSTSGRPVEQQREVCAECAQDVYEKLRLGQNASEISAIVFKELSLYKPTT